ncbi:MAG: hypothetical protein JKY12_08240 [Sneathiella sp.]|nr:hypothetical protein [Sneathiella sp.]
MKNTLLVNAANSTVAGALCLIANGPISQFMGLNDSVYLYILGAGLVLFGLDVGYTATRNPINAKFVKMIIGADIAWVIASSLIVGLAPEWVSTYGAILIEVVALSVAVFAVLQTIGLKRELNNSPQHA